MTTAKSITREELLKLHSELGAKARELMTAKNHDYAVEHDVFRNFRTFGTLGVLVRLSDKLARLRSFEENEVFKVTNESLMDTILDTLNYAVIYYAMRQEGKEPTPTVTDGPYCHKCEVNLADFREGTVFATYWCSNCAAEAGRDTSEMTLMGSL